MSYFKVIESKNSIKTNLRKDTGKGTYYGLLLKLLQVSWTAEIYDSAVA